jgi:hypothetical protein
MAANHNHNVADPGIRITSDSNLRRSEPLGHGRVGGPNAPTECPGGRSGAQLHFNERKFPGLRRMRCRGKIYAGPYATRRAPQDSFSAVAVSDSLPNPKRTSGSPGVVAGPSVETANEPGAARHETLNFKPGDGSPESGGSLSFGAPSKDAG